MVPPPMAVVGSALVFPHQPVVTRRTAARAAKEYVARSIGHNRRSGAALAGRELEIIQRLPGVGAARIPTDDPVVSAPIGGAAIAGDGRWEMGEITTFPDAVHGRCSSAAATGRFFQSSAFVRRTLRDRHKRECWPRRCAG